jgi:FkbM family methyltransferase
MVDWHAFVGRKRWLKRLVMPMLPRVSSSRIFDQLDFHYDPRDMEGPSYHFMGELEKSFINYEEATKKFLLTKLPENAVFYDIGANIGMYSAFVFLNRPDVKIFSFEPEPHAFDLLTRTFSNLARDVRLFNVAIGESKLTLPLYRSKVNDGGHSFIHGEDKETTGSVVQVVNLDEFRLEHQLPAPDLIKIDVEGYELMVLSGMKKTIEECRPVLQIESCNRDLASKGSLWQCYVEYERSGAQIFVPETGKKLTCDELSAHAQDRLNLGAILNDYYFIWN